MKRIKIGYIDPKVIMTVIVSLMILGLGSFTIFTLWGELSSSSSIYTTICQDVSDASLAQTIDIGLNARISTVTETLSDSTSQAIGSSDYSYNTATGIITITVTG